MININHIFANLTDNSVNPEPVRELISWLVERDIRIEDSGYLMSNLYATTLSHKDYCTEYNQTFTIKIRVSSNPVYYQSQKYQINFNIFTPGTSRFSTRWFIGFITQSQCAELLLKYGD